MCKTKGVDTVYFISSRAIYRTRLDSAQFPLSFQHESTPFKSHVASQMHTVLQTSVAHFCRRPNNVGDFSLILATSLSLGSLRSRTFSFSRHDVCSSRRQAALRASATLLRRNHLLERCVQAPRVLQQSGCHVTIDQHVLELSRTLRVMWKLIWTPSSTLSPRRAVFLPTEPTNASSESRYLRPALIRLSLPVDTSSLTLHL